MRVFKFWIEQETFARLEEIVGRGSVAAVVREAVAEWLERHHGQAAS